MPRPSQAQDQALLDAGAVLYPKLGCAALSVRKVAEAAGVNPAMVHYHFGSKDAFLTAVLQQVYEGMFSRLQAASEPGPGAEGDVMTRLARTLFALGSFVREHRPLIGRLWGDAMAGQGVVVDFVKANVPRHLGLLMTLLAEAEQAGRLRPEPMLTRLSFIAGAVLAPMLMLGGAREMGVLPAMLAPLLDAQVMSDEALQRRIDWALDALKDSR
ncbi:TetR/AcrR family transcriptional regulator [Roseateles paludis]|jgi:AcrR family transcriptional regulator|uniref:TetR/AcrR family transcriptional regulator n=1 Tax=Roseateles paludis TaxID=3145238 RepID=A0ABV0G358_9BURK